MTVSSFRRFSLPTLFLLSFLGLLSLRFWFPLSPAYKQIPLADIRTFTPTLAAGLAYGGLIAGLFFLTVWSARQVTGFQRPPRLRMVILAAFGLGLPLIWTFPVNATDVYRYILRGRVASVYAANPFTTPPDTFADDPLLPLAGEWAGETSPYGPVWEIVDGLVTAVPGTGLIGQLFIFKGLGLLGHLLTSGLIWLALDQRRPSERMGLTLLWAWNPALLLTFVMDAHNDVWMLVWLLAGWVMLRRKRPSLGLMVASLGALTKPIGVLALPFLFLDGWRQLSSWRDKLRFSVLVSLGVSTAVFLAFLPFGSPMALIQRLVREAGGGAGFSAGALILLLAGRLGIPLSLSAVGQGGLVVLGLGMVLLGWLAWHGRSPLRCLADAFLLYIWQALNFRIWYAVWAFPWLLLEDTYRPRASVRRQAGLWFLLTAQLSVLVYGHIRAFLLAGDHLPAHFLGVPFTFILPWVLAYSRGTPKIFTR